MRHKKLFLLKNSQCGSSVLEVIFAIGLVVAVTPFIYNSVKEMTHVVHDVSVANQIRSVRDTVLNFMRTNQSEFHNESNEISDENLAAIAPDAVKGMVYQTSIDTNGVNKNLETYLLFNIDDTKYRTSNIVKYIGGDAAVVGDDGRAYARDWAVQLPESWSDALALSDNNLVYRITRDFGGDDKTLYLHRGDFGEDNLNQMHRALHMGGFDLVNVADFLAKSLAMRMVNTPKITATDGVTANQIIFTKSASISGVSGVSLDTEIFTGDRAESFKNINAADICESSNRCKIATQNLTSSSFNLGDSLIMEGGACESDTYSAKVYIEGFSLNGDLRISTIKAENILILHSDAFPITFYVSHESAELDDETAFTLKLGDWTYINKAPDTGATLSVLPVGPSLTKIYLGAVTAVSDYSLQEDANLHLDFTDLDLDKVLNNWCMNPNEQCP